MADALDVTTDFLLGRVDSPEGFAGGDVLHRHVKNLSQEDRKFAEQFLERLAKTPPKGGSQKD